jgi:hypothetical protein
MGAMRCCGALLSLSLCLLAGTALAEPDGFELGNGQHGALRVQQANLVINTATALTATVREGSKTLIVADATGFAAGELVLVLQGYTDGPAPDPGTPGPIDLDASKAGTWELARLESVTPGALGLTAPLVSAFSAPGAQVVRVPEYASVHVQGTIVAPPWNGSSGGVLAFLVTGAVLNQGIISANAAGFRGGTFAPSPAQTAGCTDPNQSQATGGAQKGEGIASKATGAPTHGFAALANGAGGGNCDDGGGGGGGHGGAGGQGGYTAATDGSRDVGGRGGLALRYSPLTRLMFGGGGGAGAGTSTGGTGRGTSGGAGGGIIFIRARDFQGNQGIISANGESAAASGNDGAGGGGAGGHVTIRTRNKLDCAILQANGGAGGSNSDAKAHGPGGGGGGGVVLLQGQTITCSASVVSGLAGTASAAPDGGQYGATPTAETQSANQGVTTSLTEGFALPDMPTWITPAEGEVTGPRPQLQGTAQPGSKVRVLLNGQQFDNVVAEDDGTFAIRPNADLPEGPQEVRATSERLGLRSAVSEPRTFTVSISPTALQVGCGCGAAQAAGGGWIALGVLLLRVCRRGRPRGARRALAGKGRPGVDPSPQSPGGLPGVRGTARRAVRGR